VSQSSRLVFLLHWVDQAGGDGWDNEEVKTRNDREPQ